MSPLSRSGRLGRGSAEQCLNDASRISSPFEDLIMTMSPGRRAGSRACASCAASSKCPASSPGGSSAASAGHVGTGQKHQIGARFLDRLAQRPVQFRRGLAELQHVAEHRDAPPPGLLRRQYLRAPLRSKPDWRCSSRRSASRRRPDRSQLVRLPAALLRRCMCERRRRSAPDRPRRALPRRARPAHLSPWCSPGRQAVADPLPCRMAASICE